MYAIVFCFILQVIGNFSNSGRTETGTLFIGVKECKSLVKFHNNYIFYVPAKFTTKGSL